VPEEHIAAEQIYPLIKTELWYTPTVKHHCPRTALASSLRACSNKVWFEKKMFSRYSKWFKEVFIPRFVKLLSNEVSIDVVLEKWLEKYPVAYRKKILAALHPDKRNFDGECRMQYEAFTKVEMQFTTVPHDLKDTPLNDTKERQICGPTDEKKALANAFINKLEEMASKYMPEYCGRANWLDICASIDKIEQRIFRPIWGASDGSGFDMTQYPECNQLMNDLILEAARQPNVHFQEPLSYEMLKEALDGSLELDVSVDHGDLKYKAVGRASGDGWTTFGNTMLMISYWQFTFEEIANIYDYGLKVKGDDVLFCLSDNRLLDLKQAIPQVFTDKKHLHEHGLGQICKMVNFGDIEDMDFLSNDFFRTSEGTIRMTRKPARVIQTLSWSTKLPQGKKKEEARKELCHSKGMCLQAWADGLPIFGALAESMIKLGKSGKLSEFDQYADLPRVWHKGRNDYDAYCRYLNDKFGITRQEIVDVESKIRKVKELGGILNLPCLEKLYNPAA